MSSFAYATLRLGPRKTAGFIKSFDSAGTHLLASVMTKVLDHWDRLHRVFLKEVFADRLPEAQEEHRQILEAIEANDPDKVEAVIRKHNRNALSADQKYLQVRKEEGHRS